MESHAIDVLQVALKRLPGVGPKTAQRMAFHLLERDREGAQQIATALMAALDAVQHCKRCNNFSETEICTICSSARGQSRQLCVVENPADLDAIEQSAVYNGTYYVLMGHLAPLEGFGPEELKMERLVEVTRANSIDELILATNLTVEGEATAHFIGELFADDSIRVTRLARGVPVGGELEYMDHGTLEQAFEGRRDL